MPGGRRLKQSRPDGTHHDRRAGGRGPRGGSSQSRGLVKAPVEVDSPVSEESVAMIVNASSNRATRWSRPSPTRGARDHSNPPRVRESGVRPRSRRSSAGFWQARQGCWEGSRRNQRAECDSRGRRRKRRQQGPGLPGPRDGPSRKRKSKMVADPERVEADVFGHFGDRRISTNEPLVHLGKLKADLRASEASSWSLADVGGAVAAYRTGLLVHVHVGRVAVDGSRQQVVSQTSGSLPTW